MLAVAAGQSLSSVIELKSIMTTDLADNMVSEGDALSWNSVSSKGLTADLGGHVLRFRKAPSCS